MSKEARCVLWDARIAGANTNNLDDPESEAAAKGFIEAVKAGSRPRGEGRNYINCGRCAARLMVAGSEIMANGKEIPCEADYPGATEAKCETVLAVCDPQTTSQILIEKVTL